MKLIATIALALSVSACASGPAPLYGACTLDVGCVEGGICVGALFATAWCQPRTDYYPQGEGCPSPGTGAEPLLDVRAGCWVRCVGGECPDGLSCTLQRVTFGHREGETFEMCL